MLSILAIIAGLALLVWSADLFVDGAAQLARILGLSPMVIGIVIIGFGTSAPELLVSATSAFQGNSGIALGNAFGSNIANIGLILGISALFAPILMQRRLVYGELLVVLAVAALSFFWLWDYQISRLDAITMLILFVLIMSWAVISAKRHPDDAIQEDDNPPMPVKKSLPMTLLGLIVLMVSSKMMVWGAVNIAAHLGVSDLVIGLTVVAIGTSLPELASSLAAVRKGNTDMALGNIIGSNLFNNLAVVGLAGIIHPIHAEHQALTRDLPVMFAFTLLLFLMGIRRGNRAAELGTIHGLILCVGYFSYTLYLILSLV